VQTSPFFVTFAGYDAPSTHVYAWGGGGLHIAFGGQCVIERASQPRLDLVTIHSPSLLSGITGGGSGFGGGAGGVGVGRGGFAMIVGV